MIITQEMIASIDSTSEIIDQLIIDGYIGLTRSQFIQKFQDDVNLDNYPQWLCDWINEFLHSGDAILNYGEFIHTSTYRISGSNINQEQSIFTNLQDAKNEIKLKRDEYIVSENWLFHIQGVCLQGESSYTLINFDLNGDGTFNQPIQCYMTFNYKIGQYERFDTFEQAKIRCEELRAERTAEVDSSYSIYEEIQQINDPEENPKGWIFLKKFTDIIY